MNRMAKGTGLPGVRAALTGVLAVLAALALLVLPAHPALANGNGNGGAATGSVTGTYTDDERPIAGARFDAYRLATWDAKSGAWAPADGFDRYAVDWNLNDASAERLRELGYTLGSYAVRDGIAPVAGTDSGKDGSFAFGGLADGLYLVSGARITAGNLTCEASPAIVALPDANGSRALNLTPKADCVTEPTQPVSVTARKVWKPVNGKGTPESVTVQLLRDGVVDQTAVLSGANGWTHRWDGLETGHDWRVIERDVPNGYVTLVERDGLTFTVTNTGQPGKTASTGVAVTYAAGAALLLAALGLGLFALRRRRATEESGTQEADS